MKTERLMKVAGGALLTIGFAMAIMPFAGALGGMPFDGDGTWEISINRVVLHIVPGILAMGLGLAFYRGMDRKWLGKATGAALVLSVWMGLGPWLLDGMIPGHEGQMFLGIPGFDAMTRAEQLFIESLCHWIPGMVALTAVFAGFQLSRHATTSGPAVGRAA